MPTYEGKLDGSALRIAIVISRFNETITGQLLAGAQDGLRRLGAPEDATSVFWVPGAFEIPSVARQVALTGRFDAVICLGAVIRGDTPHFDYVAGNAASGIARLAFETDVPVIFGVLTTDTVAQAQDRAGGKAGNKGFDAAMTAVEMATLLRNVRAWESPRV